MFASDTGVPSIYWHTEVDQGTAQLPGAGSGRGRTTGSDAVQGVVLARLVEREGHSNVGVIFRDDTWGRGPSEAFAANFSGTATLASYAVDGQASYLAELQQAAANGAEVLVAMGFAETAAFILESIEQGVFTRFIFTAG